MAPVIRARLRTTEAPAPAHAADPVRPRTVAVLLALWAAVALALGAWNALERPRGDLTPLGDTGAYEVLPGRPAAPILTLQVHWQGPRGLVGWVVLEPGRPWSAGGEAYWRRRVVPGWNQLVWDDFSGFPAGEPVRLRVLEGSGPWGLAAPRASTGYGLSHLRPLGGLLAALALAAVAAGGLAWRALRTASPAVLRASHLALAVVLAAALGLRLYTLTTQSLWFDEVLTAIGAQSFAWVLYSPQIFGHPPLQYLLGWAAGGMQASEAWMRAPFVAAGVGSVVAVGLLGRRALGGPTGIVAAALLAISPFHIELSQLARPYALLVLGSALSWLLLLRALERGRALDWVGFSAIAAISCYTHYLAGVVLAAQALVALAWVARRRGQGGLCALVSFAAVGLLMMPWAATLTRLVGAEVGGGRAAGAALSEFVWGVVVHDLLGSGGTAPLGGLLLLLGLWRVRRTRPEIALALIALVALPLLIVWAANPARPLAGRYVAFVLPILVPMVAHGLVGAARAPGCGVEWMLGAPAHRARRAATAAAAVLLSAAASTTAWADLGQYYQWRLGSDWRTVAAVLDRSVAPGDEVVATLGAVYPLRHYWSGAVTEVDAERLWTRHAVGAAGRRLWIITLDGWDWAPDLHRWLETHAIQVGEIPASWSLTRVRIHRAVGPPSLDLRGPARRPVPGPPATS